jgi:hypothetical protein
MVIGDLLVIADLLGNGDSVRIADSRAQSINPTPQ